MATRKKTSTDSEARKQEESVPAAQPATVRKFRTAKSAAGTAKAAKPAVASTPAATHKAPSRKPLVQAVPETLAAAAGASFDSAHHHEEISREAYFNWLRRGCPHGSAHVDWHAAIEVVYARYSH